MGASIGQSRAVPSFLLPPSSCPVPGDLSRAQGPLARRTTGRTEQPRVTPMGSHLRQPCASAAIGPCGAGWPSHWSALLAAARGGLAGQVLIFISLFGKIVLYAGG